MFKDRKSSSPSKLKNTEVSKQLNTNEEEPKTSNIKKYKKKNLFTIIRQKLNSVLENKKDTLNNKQKNSKPYRSKSFEALSNSFEEADCHERVSVSEDSIYDRNKRGSRRSQSLRSKQAVCPAELGTSQNTSGSSRTELQSNSEGNNASNPHIDTEDKSVINNYITSDFKDSSFKSLNSINQIECSGNQLEEVEILKPECKKESESPCHSVNSCKVIQKQIFLPSTSVQGKEKKNFNLKDLGVTRPQYLAINAGECKSLTKEIRELSKYGWYWGPLNRCEAEEKLADQLDGAFLVRDSSDVKYLLSLSFRSYGKTLHTRIEHSNGWFSFYPQPQPDHDSYRSLVDLINHCMSESDGGVFCYSRPLIKGSPSFPVRLTKPVSRFMQVRSLQYLCRFVIRQYTSINHIQNLPIPPKIQGYLQESYY